MVALREKNITPETTHLEVDPLTILGVVAGSVALSLLFPAKKES